MTDIVSPPARPDPARLDAPLRIVLAEDQDLNARIIAFFLRREGHHVTIAANGQQALEILAREPFDLVLMDVQMPILDGMQALRRIRQGLVPGLDPKIPVIALTAHASIGDREQLLLEGMDDYLAKPLDADKLNAALVRLGSRLRGERPGATRPAARSEAEGDLDFDGLVDKFSGDAKIVSELLALYIDTSEHKAMAMEAAWRAGDMAGLAEEGHSMDGIAASFGFKSVAEACRLVRTLALGGDAEAVAPVMAALIQVLDQTNRAIRARIGPAAVDPQPGP